jgi:acetyl esterase/lipase
MMSVLAGVVALSFGCASENKAARKAGVMEMELKGDETVLLWPGGAPGALGERVEDKPRIVAFLAPKEKNTGACVIVCPGGGYHNRMDGYEGQEMAEWLNSIGVNAVVLQYRLIKHGYHYPAWFQDAQRAVSLVRSKAYEWNIRPNRIGIGGFSAGGHLSSMTGVHFDERSYEARDDIDKESCRPDFMILVYPGILSSNRSKERMKETFGDNPAEGVVEYTSTDKYVTSNTAATFLVCGTNDATVSPEHSIAFYKACREAKVPAELHIYADGPHGFGMGQLKNTGAVTKHGPAVASWPQRCEDWMRGLGLLDR